MFYKVMRTASVRGYTQACLESKPPEKTTKTNGYVKGRMVFNNTSTAMPPDLMPSRYTLVNRYGISDVVASENPVLIVYGNRSSNYSIAVTMSGEPFICTKDGEPVIYNDITDTYKPLRDIIFGADRKPMTTTVDSVYGRIPKILLNKYLVFKKNKSPLLFNVEYMR